MVFIKDRITIKWLKRGCRKCWQEGEDGSGNWWWLLTRNIQIWLTWYVNSPLSGCKVGWESVDEPPACSSSSPASGTSPSALSYRYTWTISAFIFNIFYFDMHCLLGNLGKRGNTLQYIYRQYITIEMTRRMWTTQTFMMPLLGIVAMFGKISERRWTSNCWGYKVWSQCRIRKWDRHKSVRSIRSHELGICVIFVDICCFWYMYLYYLVLVCVISPI